MEKRKEITIPSELMEDNWKTNKVVIKRLRGPEVWATRDEAANLRVTDSGVRGSPSQTALATGTIMKAVIEAPWTVQNVNAVNDLDWEMWDWLLNEINDFNSSLSKKKSLTGDSS